MITSKSGRLALPFGCSGDVKTAQRLPTPAVESVRNPEGCPGAQDWPKEAKLDSQVCISCLERHRYPWVASNSLPYT